MGRENLEKKNKVIGHRGWSAGEMENTLEAFKKAVDNNLPGVEFDIRWASDDKDKIVVSHDPCKCCDGTCFEEVLDLLSQSDLELFIEMKEYDDSLFSQTIGLLEKFGLKDRSLVFAFRPVAKKFPWESRTIKLGIISEYPWEVVSDIKKYKPDFVLMGWDYRPWTKKVFKTIWTFLSFRYVEHFYKVKIILGIALDKNDYSWLKKQKGIYGFTADRPFEWE